MKRIFIPIIFAFVFLFFGLDSYADGICYTAPLTYSCYEGTVTLYILTRSGDLSSSVNVGIAFDNDYNVLCQGSYFLAIVKNGVIVSSGGKSNNWWISNYALNASVSKYSSTSSARSALNSYTPVPPTDYDESIGLGGEFWIIQDQVFSLDLIQFGAYWKFDDIQDVKLTISGTLKSETFDFSGNGGYWFNPRDYGNIGEHLQLYLTPYDSSGNWGNTLFLHKQIDTNILTNLYQAFTGYVQKATNDVDILGIDDTEVKVIKEKPDSGGTVSNPTVINTTTYYSPVYQTTNLSDVQNYVTTYNYTTTNYYTTNNYIDNSTHISININVNSDEQQNAGTRYSAAKKYLSEAPDTISENLKSFSGTPLQPILTALIIGFGVLVSTALVMVISKLLGIIF